MSETGDQGTENNPGFYVIGAQNHDVVDGVQPDGEDERLHGLIAELREEVRQLRARVEKLDDA